jgi:2,4-dienoyl-CoA reductase-like NADH-dependent reductase (Old Yellow Enzyme family)
MFLLRNLTLKNRIMSTRHTMLCAQDEAPQQRYQVYHEERTKGGISLTMSGASYAEVLADEGIKVKFTFGG